MRLRPPSGNHSKRDFIYIGLFDETIRRFRGNITLWRGFKTLLRVCRALLREYRNVREFILAERRREGIGEGVYNKRIHVACPAIWRTSPWFLSHE